jgi:hypothetical protein
MDNSPDQSFDQQGFDVPKNVGSFPNPSIIKRILKKLTGMVVLTETEREEAGIYVGDHKDTENHP